MFKQQICKNVEVNVNDILIKSLRVEQHLADLEETFSVLRKYWMKLNMVKCVFNLYH